MEFKKYQHVCRYGTVETEGILDGICAIMPKIDGTNASVWLDSDGNICCGSRNRELESGRDNAGFYSFVMSSLGEPIRRFLNDHPNLRLYGEWLVPHSIKDYKDDAWKKFYVFDVIYENECYVHPFDYMPKLEKYGVDYIPVVAWIESPTIEDLKMFATNNKYLMKDGCIGEGVVIKNYDYKNPYGRIVWAKIINDEFKEVKKVKSQTKQPKDVDVEQSIALRYCTDALINKEYAKIMNDTPDIERRILIPKLIEMVFHSIVVEDMYDICKQYKMPTISFKTLKNECIKRIKEVKVDLFV